MPARGSTCSSTSETPHPVYEATRWGSLTTQTYVSELKEFKSVTGNLRLFDKARKGASLFSTVRTEDQDYQKLDAQLGFLDCVQSLMKVFRCCSYLPNTPRVSSIHSFVKSKIYAAHQLCCIPQIQKDQNELPKLSSNNFLVHQCQKVFNGLIWCMHWGGGSLLLCA